jgi:hypothetical protein
VKSLGKICDLSINVSIFLRTGVEDFPPVGAPILKGDGDIEENLLRIRGSSLSPHHRFVIALRSPDGVFETGLPMGPSEKRATKLACGVKRDTFSSPV